MICRHDVLLVAMTAIPDAAIPQGEPGAAFADADAALAAREAAIACGEELPLSETIDAAIALVQRLVTVYVAAAGRGCGFPRSLQGSGERRPTWNAIRDNCRELVYCRNCINIGARGRIADGCHR